MFVLLNDMILFYIFCSIVDESHEERNASNSIVGEIVANSEVSWLFFHL